MPINTDGTEDASRTPVFMAQTQLMSPEGPVPLQSTLKTGSIDEAIDEFPGAMQQALREMMELVKKRGFTHHRAGKIDESDQFS